MHTGTPPFRQRARQAWESGRSSPRLDLAFQAVRRDMRAGGELLAGALAMRLFILMLPFVAVLLATLGLITQTDPQTAQDALKGTGIASAAASSVTGSARISSNSMWVVLAGGLFALVLASRTTARTLWTIHRLAWGDQAHRPERPWLAAVLSIGGAVILFGILLLLPVLRHALGLGPGLLAIVLVMVLEIAFWLGVAWLLPHAGAPWQALVPGAVLTAVGVTLLHGLTTFWAAGLISHYNSAYGALGTAVALLVWFYVLGRIIVAGAMLSAARWERRGP